MSEDIAASAGVRIGVDVGGTFTKAVAVYTHPLGVVAQVVVPTTHDAPQGVAELQGRGAGAIVASEAFSVDNEANERLVLDVARAHGLPATAGHEVSGAYGLEVRTLTAAINASILPKMVQTANLVEGVLHEAGVDAPLVVMRGDGGVMSMEQLRARPLLTVLSGPAASLAGALL